METDEYQFAIAKLAQHEGSWPEIARQCEVSYSWLCKFAHNKIPNASYKRVKRIAGHFGGLHGRRKEDKKQT